MRDENELKPCPFCGSRAELRETFGKLFAGCSNDKCAIRPDTWLRTQTTDLRVVAKAWNARAVDVDSERDHGPSPSALKE
jgi:Restriction alleviation protein Lar